MLSGRRIILGVTGGIAAYKAAFLLRALQKEGAEVRVTMTRAATRFVGAETFATLSGRPVATDIFPEGTDPESWTRHIEWGEWADLFLIAPCTANTMAKIAGGQADNMLTSTLLAARCPVLLCPTMDGEMYRAPATRRNLQILRNFGYHILQPESGYLASGLEGRGRLPETGAILTHCREILESTDGSTGSAPPEGGAGPLAGKKVLVTAGPTREFIDAVRFISNPSSGRMGFAMAEAARDLGAEVTLLHGPVSLDPPAGVATRSFTSSAELFEVVKEHAGHDVVIMAAAVSDFSPASPEEGKIKKDKGAPTLELKPTADVLAWLGENRRKGQTLIGFAMETDKLVENASKKLRRKKADYIVANALNEEDAGFGSETNRVLLLDGVQEREFKGTKKEVARRVLEQIFGTSGS